MTALQLRLALKGTSVEASDAFRCETVSMRWVQQSSLTLGTTREHLYWWPRTCFHPFVWFVFSFCGNRRLHCTHRRVQRRTEKMLPAQQTLCHGKCNHKHAPQARLAWRGMSRYRVRAYHSLARLMNNPGVRCRAPDRHEECVLVSLLLCLTFGERKRHLPAWLNLPSAVWSVQK